MLTKEVRAWRVRASSTEMSFVPDATREPTYFIAELRQKLEFREAISALHDVVVSDLRFKPKDKTAYKEWAAQREEIDWQEVAAQRAEVAGKSSFAERINRI